MDTKTIEAVAQARPCLRTDSQDSPKATIVHKVFGLLESSESGVGPHLDTELALGSSPPRARAKALFEVKRSQGAKQTAFIGLITFDKGPNT